MTYISCEGDIRTDSKGNWWHCSTGFDELSQAELEFIAQQQASPSSELSSESVERLAAAIEQFNLLMDTLFVFDPELFGIVLLGCLMLFSKGWGLGVIVRRMSARQ